MAVKVKTKYAADRVNVTDSFYKHAIYYNDITQTPHDQLFKKSGQLGCQSFSPNHFYA